MASGSDFESRKVEDCFDGSRVYDYYEADIAENGAIVRPSAYMIRGVSGAFMDLAYGNPYPNGLYTFKCEQVKGIECGDSYGEFVVTKA